MDSFVLCPCCGVRIYPETTLCLTRMLAIGTRPTRRGRELPAPDFKTLMPFRCAACRAPLSYPLDAPMAVA
jgi:hypothetical protein